jgi:hypothetical protein
VARAGKLLVKSILSTKKIRQIPSKNVLIRDVTGLDTSKDRKSSWAIPPPPIILVHYCSNKPAKTLLSEFEQSNYTAILHLTPS